VHSGFAFWSDAESEAWPRTVRRLSARARHGVSRGVLAEQFDDLAQRLERAIYRKLDADSRSQAV
jgi:hypothetical protein